MTMQHESALITIARTAVQLYAETHPRPTHVTQAQAAERLGVSRWKVGNLVKAGKLRLNACGMIPIEQIDAVRSVRHSQKTPEDRSQPA